LTTLVGQQQGSRLEAFGVPSITWINLWKIRRKMNKVSYTTDCASAFMVDQEKIFLNLVWSQCKIWL